MRADSAELSLGRGADMDITIDSEFASRDHARIRPHGSTFVLADVSTNGTFVNLDDSVVFIHDDEVILRGQGWISLGKHASESMGKVLYFSSETGAR
nr:FHA domain-containing protein [Thiorhodococcus minor]